MEEPAANARDDGIADPEREGTGGRPQGLAMTAPATGGATGGATTLMGQAKQQLADTAATHKDGIADQIDQLADTVHRSGEQFAGKQDWLAGAIDGGAQELSTLATALREQDLGTLLGHVGAFARRQPAVFIGASFAAGFALARVGKVAVADVSRADLPTMPEVGHGR